MKECKNLVCVISKENKASLELHRNFGFKICGNYEGLCEKGGKPIDRYFLHLNLDLIKLENNKRHRKIKMKNKISKMFFSRTFALGFVLFSLGFIAGKQRINANEVTCDRKDALK